jgi:hypothetical protein
MVPSRHAQKAARRGGESPSPTGPRERDTKGANDAKQRRKVEPADLDAARRTSEDAMRRLSTQDDDDLPQQAAARPAPVAVAETASSPWSPDQEITALVRDASQRGRDAVKARKPKDVDKALHDTTAALRGSDFMHKFSGESDALLEAFLESGPAPIPQRQDA